MRISTITKKVEIQAQLWLKVTSGQINSTISDAVAKGILVCTARETCKLLNISLQTLKHLIDTRVIPYYMM